MSSISAQPISCIYRYPLFGSESSEQKYAISLELECPTENHAMEFRHCKYYGQTFSVYLTIIPLSRCKRPRCMLYYLERTIWETVTYSGA